MRSGGVMQGFDAATWAVIGLQVRWRRGWSRLE